MTRLLVVFIDGLAAHRVTPQSMPFVSQFRLVPLMSQAGFSTTCWGNLFTGLYPEDHGHWFQIVRSPSTSPFKPAAWVPEFAYRRSHYLLRMVWQRLLTLPRRNRSVFGYPFMHFVRPAFWKYFDVVEDKVFGEPGFYHPHGYLFEFLTDGGVSYQLLGVHPTLRKMQQGVATVRLQLAARPDLASPDLLFVLFGDIDYLSHYTGPDSPAVHSKLREIDRLVECLHRDSGGNRDIIILSDHGHLQIVAKIDIYEYVPELLDHVHQIEDMYVRVWHDDDEVLDHLSDRLRQVPGLTILSDDVLIRHRLPLDRDRHGHLIAVLDHGLSFLRTSWTRFNKFLSDHGYLPDHHDLHAFLAGTVLAPHVEQGNLVDFLPTLFSALGLPLRPEFRGQSLAGETATVGAS